MDKKKILIIEDEYDMRTLLTLQLESSGYDVFVAADGQEGLDEVKNIQPDLVILDLMLPELDGFRVLRSLRQQGHSLPILVLTAKGEEADKVRGLRMGADDYVTKPFGLLELLARVEALLRRSSTGSSIASATMGVQRVGEIEIDPAARTVCRRSQPVDLAPKEFDLLWALLRARGAVVSRLQLMREVWGYSAAVVSRTVDTHISELRRKLEENPAVPQHILTVRKTGYRIRK